MLKNQGTNPIKFLNELDKTIQTMERDLEKQERYIRGLRLARENVASVILEGASQPRQSADGSRVAVLKEILAAAPEPMAVDDIMAELQRRGRSDDRRNVYSTISYLKRVGSVKNTDRGLWSAVSEHRAA